MKTNDDDVKKNSKQNRRRGIFHKVEIPPPVSLLSERISLINKTNNSTQQRQLRTLTLALTLFAVGGMIFSGVSYGGGVAVAQAQQEDRQEVSDVTETQSVVSQSVSTVESIDNSRYHIRWSTAGTIEGNNGVGALLAECLPGEIPLTPLYDLWKNVGITKQLIVGVGNHLSLLLLVQNYGNEPQAVSAGIACIDQDGNTNGDDGRSAGDNVNVDNSVQITNIVKNIIKNTINNNITNRNITIIGN